MAEAMQSMPQPQTSRVPQQTKATFNQAKRLQEAPTGPTGQDYI